MKREIHTATEGKWSCEDRGRCWSDIAISQGKAGATTSWERQRRILS